MMTGRRRRRRGAGGVEEDVTLLLFCESWKQDVPTRKETVNTLRKCNPYPSTPLTTMVYTFI